MEEMNLRKVIGFGFLGLVGLISFFGSYAIVGPGERGILVTLGKPSDTILTEGFHLKMPLISSVRNISVRIQKTESVAEAATKDLQRVHTTVALNWHLDPSLVNQMYRNVGDEHAIAERIIGPAVAEVVKASTARLSAEEVLTRRMELKKTIDEMLISRLSSYNVIVKDISLVNLNFTNEFNRAIEAKQVSEQQAKQAEYVAQKATQDAKAVVNTARGRAEADLTIAKAQAESQKLLKQTITPEILQLEYLKRWNGVLPTVMSGSSSGLMFNLNNQIKKPVVTGGSNE